MPTTTRVAIPPVNRPPYDPRQDSWQLFIDPYMKVDSAEAFDCPSRVKGLAYQRGGGAGSYGFNYFYLNKMTAPNVWAGVKESSVANPSETVAVTEGATYDIAMYGVKPNTDYGWAVHICPPSEPSGPVCARPSVRHAGMINVGFADGHVQTMKREMPFYPPFGDPKLGNGIRDPKNPNYLDGLWDRE